MPALTDAQLELRRTGLTATDIPAIMGLSPWKSAFDVWVEKREPPAHVDPEPGSAMWLGTHCEPILEAWYQSQHPDARLRGNNETIRHPKYPIVLATPDRFVDDPDRGQGLAEYKTSGLTGGFVKGWGAPGTDLIPEMYLAQTQWQMGAAQRAWCDVPAMIAGRGLVEYEVLGDEDFFGHLYENIALPFWHDYVQAGKVPEDPGPSEQTSRALAKHFNKATAGMLTIAPENAVCDAITALHTAVAIAKDAGTKADALKNLLKVLIANNKGMVGEFGKLYWSPVKGRTITKWQDIVQALRERLTIDDILDGTGEAQPGLIAAHTEIGEPGRTFKTYWNETFFEEAQQDEQG